MTVSAAAKTDFAAAKETVNLFRRVTLVARGGRGGEGDGDLSLRNFFQGFSAPKFAKISAPAFRIVLVSFRAPGTNI